MNKKLLINLFSLFSIFFYSPLALLAQGSNIIQLTGKIIDQEQKEPISGVTILIQGTVNGTSTDLEGNFKLQTRAKYPFSLLVKALGYEPKTYEVKGPESNIFIALSTQTILGQEVVVTASRQEDVVLYTRIDIT